MRRLWPILAFVGLLWSPGLVTAAYNSDPIQLSIDERSIHQPVDRDTWCGDCGGVDYTTGSPWTINPGWIEGYTPPIIATGNPASVEDGCVWDLDDYFNYVSVGNVLNAGATLTATECRWPSNNERFLGGTSNYLVWYSSSKDLVIQYRWSWDAIEYAYTAPPPVRISGGQWKYAVCVEAPYPGQIYGYGTEIAVPGSHDGDGVYQLVTVTITNPASTKATKTGGFFNGDIRSKSLYCDDLVQL